jgi:hypothetical protein
MAEEGRDVNWAQVWQMLRELGGRYAQEFGPQQRSLPQPLPLQEAREPLLGMTGIQRTASGRPATWMHMGVNFAGLEWLIPLLTSNQSPEALKQLLSELPIPPEERRQIEDKAIEFAIARERQEPGTFAKYGTVLEADRAAQSPSKQLIIRDDPMPWKPTYPGRE